jgi:methylated-DNA-[protein]-cysteine S-methyltransferase
VPATFYHLLPSPIGELLLTSDCQFVTGVHMDGKPGKDMVADKKVLAVAVNQLKAYLAGELTRFDLPVRQDGTPFQQRVWGELVHIPFGAKLSYQQVAERFGTSWPSWCRATG